MRFVTFRLSGEPGSDARAGVLLPFGVVDLQAAAPLAFDDVDGRRVDLQSLLDGDSGLGLDSAAEIVNAVLEQLGGAIDVVDDDSEPGAVDLAGTVSIGGAELLLPRSEARLLAPLPRPGSVRCFEAFEAHTVAGFARRGLPLPASWYDAPPFRFANRLAVLGPGAQLAMPRSEQLDFELEVACVIGRECRDVDPADALDYIAGLTIVNDWTARDREAIELLAGLGANKSKDFALSLGPWLVTPDELEDWLVGDGDAWDLPMVARINGRELSRGSLATMYHRWPAIIAHASRDSVLYPGDVLSSGAVGGGSILDLGPETLGGWIEPDDVVELEVGGLGVLRNRIGYG